MNVAFHFESSELPRLLNETGLLPAYPPELLHEDRPRIDLTPIKKFNLTLCLGKEWHRFSSHYLIPNGVKIDFIKSEFDGLLPGHFKPSPPVASYFSWARPETRYVPQDTNDLNQEESSHYVSSGSFIRDCVLMIRCRCLWEHATT